MSRVLVQEYFRGQSCTADGMGRGPRRRQIWRTMIWRCSRWFRRLRRDRLCGMSRFGRDPFGMIRFEVVAMGGVDGCLRMGRLGWYFMPRRDCERSMEHFQSPCICPLLLPAGHHFFGLVVPGTTRHHQAVSGGIGSACVNFLAWIPPHPSRCAHGPTRTPHQQHLCRPPA